MNSDEVGEHEGDEPVRSEPQVEVVGTKQFHTLQYSACNADRYPQNQPQETVPEDSGSENLNNIRVEGVELINSADIQPDEYSGYYPESQAEF